MRADDLDLRELLEFHPQGGVIRFARERALILDAVALEHLARLPAAQLHDVGLRESRPPHIPRARASQVVNETARLAERRQSHLSNEGRERAQPWQAERR